MYCVLQWSKGKLHTTGFFYPNEDVGIDIFSLKCRMTPNVFREYYRSHEEHFRYSHHVVSMRRKFSRGIWSKKLTSKIAIFAKSQLRKKPVQRVWILKNRHLLAFVSMKCDLSIVWPRCLFQQRDMILRKHPNTYNGYWKLFKKFLEPLKAQAVTF